VSVGIGGNDVGFTDVVLGCVALVPFGSPRQDRYVVDGVDEISRRIDWFPRSCPWSITWASRSAPGSTPAFLNTRYPVWSFSCWLSPSEALDEALR